MNPELLKHYRLILLALGTAAAIFAGRSARMLAMQPLPTLTEWPNPEQLDSLSVYLSPVLPPGTADFGFEEERVDDPFDRSRGQPPVAPAQGVVTSPPAETRRGWIVSAILISDLRRVAVINNALFTLGDQLPGGARIAAIEKDSVVVVQPDGMRRSLPVESGGNHES